MARTRCFPVVVGLVVAVAAVSAASPAFARKQFLDEFKAMYVKADSSDAAEKAIAAGFETEKCNVCHMGKNKKDRNAYGTALAGALEKNEKDVQKIKDALAKVAAMASDGKSGPTFGDLIKQGKLPGGAAAN